MKSSKKYYGTLCALLFAVSAYGQSTFVNSQNKWHEGYVNELYNIRYNSINPTRLSYNKMRTVGTALFSYQYGRGDYHAVDAPKQTNDLNVYIGGLQHLGKVNLAGYLKYNNTKSKDIHWNPTLYLDENNPFILCDSVMNDAITEAFQMEATLSYDFNDRIKGGLSLGLKTGSLSDQTDPRPKTNTSVFPITAGFDYHISKPWSVGLTAQVRLLSSNISYAVVNPLNNHRFFLMKGMGDYYGTSTSAEYNYKRDYKGNTLTGALQAVYQPEDEMIQNFIEVAVSKGNEKATDGGSSYVFKGGDYYLTKIKATDRFIWNQSESLRHNIILSGQIQKGDADWYDQKRMKDTEHGNLVYYEILTKSRVQKSQSMTASAEYRLDLLKDGETDFYAGVNAAVNRNELKHYSDDGLHKQEWNLLSVNISAGKTFNLGKGQLAASVNGGYAMPLQDSKFATGTNVTGATDITSAYVLPQFEYATSKRIALGGMIDYSLPVVNKVKAGIYAKVKSLIYNDDAEYYQPLKSTSYTLADMGLYLNF